MTQENSASASASAAPSYSPAGKRFIFFVGYMVALSAFGSFVNDMYLPTLPEMVRAFHTSVSTVQLGLTMGMVGLGVGELILGPVSDKYGRKPVMNAALAVFCLAAAISCFSPSIHFFIVCRLVQGLGASAGYFLARTIPADFYSGRQLGKVMALVGGINGFAPATAPVLGGFVAKSIGWQGVFWILCGFSAVLIVLSHWLQESLPKERRSQVSLLKTFGNYKYLLKNRPFIIHSLFKGSALGILFAYISSAPFIIQTHYGYSALDFGLFMGLNALFVVAGALLAMKFKSFTAASTTGAVILAAAVGAQVIELFFIDTFWAYELLNLPIIFALGLIFTSSNTMAMNDGRSYAGGASALLGVAGYIFGATVSPLVGLGDIMHSTAIAFIALTALTAIFAFLSARIKNL